HRYRWNYKRDKEVNFPWRKYSLFMVNKLSYPASGRIVTINRLTMHIQKHQIGEKQIAEVIAEEVLIHTAEDGLDVMGSLYFQGFDKSILYEKQLSPTFFDLQNGMAGEVLQKFSNYRMELAVIGDFSKYDRKSVKDFIFESNAGHRVNFVASLDEALR